MIRKREERVQIQILGGFSRSSRKNTKKREEEKKEEMVQIQILGGFNQRSSRKITKKREEEATERGRCSRARTNKGENQRSEKRR